MKKRLTILEKNSHLLEVIFLLIILGCSSTFAGTGALANWHANTDNWYKPQYSTPVNKNQMLSVTTGGSLYCSSGAGMEATPGGHNYNSDAWNGGSGTKGWVFPVNTTGFQNLVLSFYQRSRIQLGTEVGPRDFKLQYSTNGTTYTDVAGASYTLTTSYQQFTTNLPAACNNQATLYLKIVLSSNISLTGGTTAAVGVSDIADIKVIGDEINHYPVTAMGLSKTLIVDSLASGTTVGYFHSTDANLFDIFTYSLVAGTGDAQNGSFTIVDSTLKTSGILYEGAYPIRVQVSDGTNTFVANYVVTVSHYPLVNIFMTDQNSDAWITRVQAGSAIDRSSGMSGPNNSIGYSNYISDVIPVQRGATVSLTVTAQVVTSYKEFIRAYFDWNHDYDLKDTITGNERVDLLKNSNVNNTTLTPTGTFTVPSFAKPGATRMRVTIDNYGVLAMGTVGDYGEAEDYTVYVISTSFADGSSFSSSVSAGSPDQALGCFSLTGNYSGISLTGAVIKLNGVRTGFTNFKLWASVDDTFGGDTQVGSTVAADPGDGGNVSFTFSNPINAGTVYYFLTADLADDATGSLQGVIVNNSSLTFTGTTFWGTISNAVLSTSALPVELNSFTAKAIDGKVKLSWKTATEVNNYGFEVERQVGSRQVTVGNEDNPQWEKVGFVAGAGNSNSPKEYSFVDENPSSGKVQYRLKQINTDGSFGYYNQLAEVNYNVTDVKEKQLPTEFALQQNYPNPFNPSTKIRYEIPTFSTSSHLTKGEDRGGVQEGLVMLKVYDILGNEVATLVNEHKAPGYYEVEFSAGSLATGVYIYRLTAGSFVSTKKLILMK